MAMWINHTIVITTPSICAFSSFGYISKWLYNNSATYPHPWLKKLKKTELASLTIINLLLSPPYMNLHFFTK